MKQFLWGCIAGVILVPLVFYLFVITGALPVATSAPPLPFEKPLSRMALRARMLKERPKQVPIATDEQGLVAGAEIYREHCAFCHGLPNQRQTADALGMFPRPPELLNGKGATNDPAQSTFWKVRNGIRLSGMPGYSQALSDRQIWQVSLLLLNADKLPPSAREALQPQPTAPLASVGAKLHQ
jgi:thiosulfate dehydrogenase